MARSLSRALTHLTNLTSTKPTTRLVILRNQSTNPDTANPKKKDEAERAALMKLEESIHRLIVKRSQPDWIQLVPGGSYWVPPVTVALGLDQVVANLVKDSPTEAKEVRNNDLNKIGWPSSAHFFKGVTHSPLEGETTSRHSNQSEEEEG